MGMAGSKNGRQPITEQYGNLYSMMANQQPPCMWWAGASSADALLGQLEGLAGPGGQSQGCF